VQAGGRFKLTAAQPPAALQPAVDLSWQLLPAADWLRSQTQSPRLLGAMGSWRCPCHQTRGRPTMRCVRLCPVIRAISTIVSRCFLWRQAYVVPCKRLREDRALDPQGSSSPQQADHPAPHNQLTTRKLSQRMAPAEALTPVTAHRSTQKSHGPKHGTPLLKAQHGCLAASYCTSLKPVPPLHTTVPLSPINGVSSLTTGASAPPLFSPAAFAGVFFPADAFNGSRPGWVQ
jgi:hypothetical protein